MAARRGLCGAPQPEPARLGCLAGAGQALRLPAVRRALGQLGESRVVQPLAVRLPLLQSPCRARLLGRASVSCCRCWQTRPGQSFAGCLPAWERLIHKAAAQQPMGVVQHSLFRRGHGPAGKAPAQGSARYACGCRQQVQALGSLPDKGVQAGCLLECFRPCAGVLHSSNLSTGRCTGSAGVVSTPAGSS